ncbi:hypothetical protein [Nocardiopsis sp. Huas11]|uniref:hypothetical protein n=1 Tax=Nocardiopsis sp. Huas11 TaxID=2183912 RepID=UPI0011C45D77|nr:hypothetical protein [Nocardiopsis sp. Huas11]
MTAARIKKYRRQMARLLALEAALRDHGTRPVSVTLDAGKPDLDTPLLHTFGDHVLPRGSGRGDDECEGTVTRVEGRAFVLDWVDEEGNTLCTSQADDVEEAARLITP